MFQIPSVGATDPIHSSSLTSYPNIILITIDTLRSDHMGVYGYPRETTPHIDKFAKNAIVLDSFISVLPTTLASFATYFTGLFPYRHGILESKPKIARYKTRLFRSYPTLPELLPQYEKIAITGNTYLNEQTGFTRGFNKYTIIPHRPIEKAGLHSQNIADEALLQLQSVSHEKPVFFWVHFLDPHKPYYVPEDIASKFENDNLYTSNKKDAYKIAQYDRELFNVDRHAGRILEYLAKNDYLNNSIIIITSDHGESLGENNYHYHGGMVNECSILIPLIIRIPNIVTTGRREHLLCNVDFLPTLLSLIRLPCPKHVQGKNFSAILLNPSAREIHESIFIQNEINYKKKFEEGLRTKTHKIIKSGKKILGKGAYPLFDRTENYYIYTTLKNEPKLKDFNSPYGAPPDSFKKTLDNFSVLFDKYVKSINKNSPSEEITYSQDEINELLSLGYLDSNM